MKSLLTYLWTFELFANIQCLIGKSQGKIALTAVYIEIQRNK